MAVLPRTPSSIPSRPTRNNPHPRPWHSPLRRQAYTMYSGMSRFRRNFREEGVDTSDERRNPYVTVVAVWIVSSLGLGLMVSFPISFVVLLLVLAVVGCVAYKAYHRDLGYRDLAEKLFSDSRLFAVKVFEDFGIVFAWVSAWW